MCPSAAHSVRTSKNSEEIETRQDLNWQRGREQRFLVKLRGNSGNLLKFVEELKMCKEAGLIGKQKPFGNT